VSAVTVYRFFQEALLNVVKHADVDEADASLAVEGEQVVARVRDAGPGFVPSQVQSSGGRHVGLGLLRERARLAGGSLEIVTAPGDGTELTLRLPRSPRSAMVLGSNAGSTPEPVLRA
jgi:signal transduction histidine kinase